MALVTKHLVKTYDIGVNNNLFGGRMLEWVDEAGALFLIELLPQCHFVTFKIDEVVFHKPVHVGEVVSFDITSYEVGTTSIKLFLSVNRGAEQVLSVNLTFVNVGPDGHSAPLPANLTEI